MVLGHMGAGAVLSCASSHLQQYPPRYVLYLSQHQSHDAEQPRYANASQAIEHRVLVVLAQSVWTEIPGENRCAGGQGQHARWEDERSASVAKFVRVLNVPQSALPCPLLEEQLLWEERRASLLDRKSKGSTCRDCDSGVCLKP